MWDFRSIKQPKYLEVAWQGAPEMKHMDCMSAELKTQSCQTVDN